jgi:hypothetical protein
MNRRDFRRLMSGATKAPTFTSLARHVNWTEQCMAHDQGSDPQLEAGGVMLSWRQSYLAYLRFGGIAPDRKLLADMLAGRATGRFAGQVLL